MSTATASPIESVLVENRVFPPPADFAAKARISGMEQYQALCAEAENDYQGFWARLARENVVWSKPFTQVLDDSNPPFYRWFADGELNASANCLDKHMGTDVEHKTAIIFEADGGEVEEGDELYEHFAVDVDRGQEPMRLDKFLTLRMQHCSRNRIQTAVDSGSVLVGGRPAKSSYKVKPLDRITVVMPYPKREVEIVPQNIPLDIPYEDDDLLIVDKPAGMVVHPGHGNWDGTLVNALTYHLRTLPMFREGDLRAGLVHRIDKDTSGLLVVAKNERAHARLAKQFFDHTIVRRYYALVWGNPDADEGTIEGNIGRSPKDKLQMCVFADGEQGKHAVTHWRVVRRYGYVTLVECRLETGRTHQIRVHMAWKGFPLFNDARYGGARILKGTTFSKYRQFVENCFALLPRQALHARCLGFVHPSTGREVYFESELPADFRAVLDRWENYAAHVRTDAE